jgi:hypothetical protein
MSPRPTEAAPGVSIRPLLAGDWPAARRIYEAGIASGSMRRAASAWWAGGSAWGSSAASGATW